MPAPRPTARPVLLAMLGVLHGLLVAAALGVLHGLADGRPWDWGEFAAYAAMFGLVTWANVALQGPMQRFFGRGRPDRLRRADDERTVTRAVRAGELPPDADPAWWRERLGRWIRAAQGFRFSYASLAAGVAALVAVTAVRVDRGDPAVLALAAVLAAGAPALLLATRPTVRRARRLREVVAERS